MFHVSSKRMSLIAVAVVAVLALASLGIATMSPEAQAKAKDRPPRLPDFTVEITGAGSGSDVDSAWETASGGSLNIEIADASVGTDQTHTTTPGHKYVEELTLRGPLTAGRTATGKGSPNGGRGHLGVNEGSYEILENGAGKFKIDIQGAQTASANVESITIEDLVIDVREMTTGADWDYRVYGPGDAHYGSITIRSRVGKDSKELYQWWLDTSRGKNIRKQISVIALRRDGSEARSYNFLECFPTRYQPLVLDGTSRVSVEEVTAKCEGVDMKVDGNRQSMMDWITETVQGKEWKRNVTVTEITKDGSDGKTYTYIDAFPTRYVFPAFSSSGTGNLYEEVTMKPIRLELS
jgi:phage tail-like protein